MRIIVLFNLRSDADPEAYESWAKDRDLPGVRAMSSIDDFNIYRATGLLGSTDAPPFDYVQIIDIGDIEGFWKDIASNASTEIAKEFRAWVDGPPLFLMTEPLSVA
jgi:hypothetical protein